MLGLTFDNGNISGEYLVKTVFQIDMNRSKWVDLLVIYAMVIIYRLIFLIMIKIKENITPWLRGKLAQRSLKRSKSAIHSATKAQVPNMSPFRP